MKRTVALVIGIIIMICAVVGYSAYFKDNPLKLSFKSSGGGNSGSDFFDSVIDAPGTGDSITSGTIKGDYLHCAAKNEKYTEEMYVPFTNGISGGEAVIKGSAVANLSEGTKEEWEAESTEICYYGTAHDCNVSWSGNTVHIIALIPVPDEYKGLTKTELAKKLEAEDGDDVSVTCKSVTSAPNPISNLVTSNNTTEKKQAVIEKNNEKAIESNGGNIVTEAERKNAITSNSHYGLCFNTGFSGGTSDVDFDFIFYCDKNVVQRMISVKVKASFSDTKLFGKNDGHYTKKDAETELKTRYCNSKLSDCEITWKSDTYVELEGMCKTNYAGLSKSTLEEFQSGWDINNALSEICE